MKLWVLWWRYADGSASGVALVFKVKETAEAQQRLMVEHATDKAWSIVEVDYIGY